MRQRGRRSPTCFGLRINLTMLLSMCVLSVIVFYVWCISQMEWGHDAPSLTGDRRVRAVQDDVAPSTLAVLAEESPPSKAQRSTTGQVSTINHISATTTTRSNVHVPTINHDTTTSLTTTTKPPQTTATTRSPTTAKPTTTSTVVPTTSKASTTTTTTTASSDAHPPLGVITLTSFDATQSFLKSLDRPMFLLFTCAKSPDTHEHWSSTCADAEAAVLTAYHSLSPRHRLAIVRVGSSQAEADNSPFRSDFDILLHDVPTFMRYERNNQGYANTSFVLEGQSVANADLIEYALTEAKSVTSTRKNSVETISDYAAYRRMARLFEDLVPTYLLFMSGSWPHNNRVWCVYCRHREAVVEFAFHKYAAPNAKLIKVQVAQLPADWNKDNPYKKLDIAYVPYMLVPHVDAFEMLFYQHYRGELDDVDMLRSMFERDAKFVAEGTALLNPGVNSG